MVSAIQKWFNSILVQWSRKSSELPEVPKTRAQTMRKAAVPIATVVSTVTRVKFGSTLLPSQHLILPGSVALQ